MSISGAKRTQIRAKERELARLKAKKLPPRDQWPKREPGPEPRILPARQRPDGGWVMQGRDIVKALKKARAAVLFGGIVLNPALLRQYANVLKNDWLVVYPANGDGKLHIRTADGRNKATINHGARDKYCGLNGYNAEIIFLERNKS